ncbi:MAG: carboxypeptidase regulatory-like domain-containing protein [Tenuifilaceae bacterium]
MLKTIRFLSMLTLLIIVSVMVSAQGVTTSALSGRVLDNTGAPLPGATILAVHEPSGTTYGTTSQGDGSYVLTGLRVGGPYLVTISFVGYNAANYKDVDLKLGETFILNGDLKDSSTELQEVVVSALRNPILSSQRTGAQTNISRRDITSLPTISRSLTDLSRLTPQAQGNSFAGRDGRFNTITVDGAAFNNNFGLSSNPLPGGNAQPISLDAIDQVTVNIAPFDVRLSQFTGASINAITRSGDNTFKGSVYSYMRPESFTGNTVDGKDVSGANDRSSNNYGLSVGGPIIKNKVFFFVNGEFENEDVPGINWKPSTDGISNSDLMISRTTEADMIRVSDHLKSVYDYDPGKYKNFDPFKNKNTKILARIDWNINANHKLTFRYNDVVGTSDQSTNFNSGPPNNPRSSGRISSQSMAFSNSFYGFKNTVRSFTGEINSILKSNISNKFLASYTFIQDTRTTPSKLFPFVDIWQGGDQYMSFGTELFSFNNDVTNKTLSIVNNTTINLSQHTITAGVSFDRLFFRNSYIREGTTYYRYASVDDFINNATPSGFGVTYGYDGVDAPGAELTFGLGAIYGQDEWKISPELKVTLGLRVELPFFFDKLKDNPAISALTFANNQKIDVSSWPEQSLLYSPRIGFNWDVKGDRSLQVRGGSGIFTGLLPFVWFTNQPTNSGVLQAPEIGWGSQGGAANLTGLTFQQDYKAFIASRPDLFPQSPTSLPNNSGLVEVSKDFKMPQVWRTNLAADVELPYNMVFTGEALIGKDINAIQQININEAAPTGTMVGPDNRPFWTTTASRKVVSTVGNATVLTNTSEGYQYSLTAQLTKNFSNGLSGMFAYTYSQARDISSNPGSAAYSAYSSNTAVGSLNNPELSYSNFSTPHQFVGYASYKIDYAKMFATTITVSYRGYQTGRWSYIYSNDLNNDGISSDLMYIPKDASEITFVDYDPDGSGPLPVAMTAADQSATFFSYINGNKYLSEHKGEYAERFGEVQPWVHRFDIKILQDIFSNFGTSRKYTLQLSLDLLNVGNMINDSWGTFVYHPLASYENIRPLTRVALPTATAAPTFRLNATSIDDFASKSRPTKSISVSNTWGALLGLRLIF